MSLKQPERKSGNMVLPGERLGVIEEFLPDSGTYVRDSIIYSKIVGHALMDLCNKRVSVYPLITDTVTPKVGTIILGQVGNAQSDNALIKVFKITNKKISGSFGGILHISDVSDRYITSMNDVCKTGDIIRAKIISEKNQIYHLTTQDKNLGVLYAFCSRCSTITNLDHYELRCPKCGNIEKRKTAIDYGTEPF